MFKHLAVLFVAAAFFCIDANAQQLKWQKYTSAEGKFTATMPCKPEVEIEKPDPEDEEDSVEQTYHSCTLPSGYFMVTYTDFKDVLDSKTMLDTYRDGTAEGSKIISEKPVWIGRVPGRELVVSKDMDGQEMIFKWRFYLRGNRMWAMASGTDVARSKSPDVTKFLTSLALLR